MYVGSDSYIKKILDLFISKGVQYSKTNKYRTELKKKMVWIW